MEKRSRVVSSAKNIASNFISNIFCYILRFLSRTIFIKTIGEFYLGINGLLSNVLNILSLAELGISAAINYSLYKPLRENNEKKILVLMKFYKTAYRVIALVVLILGLALFPFLDIIIKDNPGYDNLNLIYFIFVVNMVISYLFSYRRTLASADQKAYKIVTCTAISTLIATIAQIIVLILTKNYIIYLLIQTLFIILENLLVNHFIDKEYPYLKRINQVNEKLDEDELKQIKINVKALIFHRLGDTCINSTDNIIISSIIGISAVGIYSNYLLLMGMVQAFILIIFNNLVASFGNLIAEGNKEKNYEIFKIVNFLSFIIYFVATICFLNLYNPFIKVWIGDKWLLPSAAVLIIVINFYMAGMRVALATVKTAAGIYDADKFDPIIHSIINIVVSIILAKSIGITGVFIGTFISAFVPLIHRPFIVYKKVFEKPAIKYFYMYFKQTLLVTITALVTYFIINSFGMSPGVTDIAVRLVISIVIPTISILIFYYNTDEFKKLKQILFNLLGGLKNGKKN